MGGHYAPVDPAIARPHLCVVLGQTASGKSRLALEIARRSGGEVISMDALKVYRGMDVGTAKITAEESVGVPVHLVNLVDPNEGFNVAQYLQHLETLLADMRERRVFPVIDCGTPLYLQVFLTGMLDGPAPDDELRAELDARSSDDLMHELHERDPVSAGRLHVNDRKRLIRALEYAIQTGEPISERQHHFGGPRRRDDFRMLLTAPVWNDELLKVRIDTRIDRMLQRGLLDEVRRIREQPGFSRSAGEAIGYRQMLRHLDGDISFDEAVTQIRQATWRLSRKQHTWFKRHAGVHWLQVASEAEIDRAALFLSDELAENDQTGSIRVTAGQSR